MSFVADNIKIARYSKNFLQNRLIHTNLQLLYRCNFKCEICDFWKAKEQKPEISLEQIKIMADKLSRIGPQIVSIGGGEPLMHKDIVPIVRALSRYHFPVMITNGWFTNQENAKALFEAGVEEISVSVDYADPKKHDTQRGIEGAYDRAIKALALLRDNRKLRRQRVHMFSVIMENNLDDVEPLPDSSLAGDGHHLHGYPLQ